MAIITVICEKAHYKGFLNFIYIFYLLKFGDRYVTITSYPYILFSSFVRLLSVAIP